MKQMGLRKILNWELQQKGYLTIDEAHRIAKSEGHKESNAERRLRPSESPYADPDYSPHPPRAIIGYKYIGTEKPKINIQTFPQISIFQTK